MNAYLFIFGVLTCAAAQQYQTPVPILKQINRHNEDGSYSYGYEGADGSYKIESKYPSGEVFGKYGYVDDRGQLREIEYGASRRGFEPQGNDIKVPPPTINEASPARALGPNEEDDGQYREDPSIYYKDDRYNSGPQRPAYNGPTFEPGPQQFQPQSYRPAPAPAPAPAPSFRPVTKFNFNDFANFNPQPYRPQTPNYYPAPAPAPVYHTQHASNVDVNAGSYTVNYRRR